MSSIGGGTRVAVNAVASYGRFLLTMGVLVLMTPFIVRHVGEQDFGIWTLTFSVVGFLGLLDGGLATSVVKYVGECRGTGDISRRNTILSALFQLYLFLAGLSLLALLILSCLYGRLFSIPAANHDKAQQLLWLIGLRSVVFALPLSLFHGILFGEQRVYLINAVQVIITLFYAATTWIGLSHGGGIVLLGILNLAAMLLEYGAYVVLAYRLVPGLRLQWGLPDRGLLQEVATFSGAQFLVNVAALVRLRTDPILVTFFLPLSAVALYGVALRISEAVFLLTKQAVNTLAPLVAELKGAEDRERLRHLLLLSTRHIFAAATALTVPICVLAPDILRLWVGSSFIPAAPVLIVLMIGMWLAMPQQVAATVLVMSGHHSLITRAQVAGMFLNLAASLLLVSWLGLVGVAAGTLVATVVIDVVYVLPAACRRFDVRVSTYLRYCVAPSLVIGIIQGGITGAVSHTFPAQSLPSLLVAAFTGLVTFLLIYGRFGMSALERAGILERLSMRFLSFARRLSANTLAQH